MSETTCPIHGVHADRRECGGCFDVLAARLEEVQRERDECQAASTKRLIDELAKNRDLRARLAMAELARDAALASKATLTTDLNEAQRENEALRSALNGLIAVMELQEGRADGSYHLSAEAFRPLWDKAKKAALDVLPEPRAALSAKPAPAVKGTPWDRIQPSGLDAVAISPSQGLPRGEVGVECPQCKEEPHRCRCHIVCAPCAGRETGLWTKEGDTFVCRACGERRSRDFMMGNTNG